MLTRIRFSMTGTALVSVLALAAAGCSKNESMPESSQTPAATPAAAPYVFDRPFVPPSPSATADPVGRGRYLVESIVGCGNCHSSRDDETHEIIPGMELAGNFVIMEEGFTAYAPNITPDPETGIGTWTDKEIERAIREGIAKDGHLLGPPMAFPFYHDISTNDMNAIIAYLHTVPAVNHVVPKSEIRMELPPSWGTPVTEPIPDTPRTDEVAYGHYLAHTLGHCTDCHTPLVNGVHDFTRTGAGGNLFNMPFHYPWAVISANITSDRVAGIGAWTDDEIKRAITMGISRNGRQLLPFMGFSFYDKISDEDLDAIVAYLRSLPPATAAPPAVD